jgi:transcriptional regulator with XRE-family HTH domain
MTGRREKNPYFGEILRAYRLEKQLTQEQLSERVDVLRSFISSLENGTRQPSLQMILKLAAALGVRPGDMINELADRIAEK